MSEPNSQPAVSEPRHGMRIAVFYALQMVACSVVILSGYELARGLSPLWAIVTAAVVLQPDLKQSWTASLNRIAANLVGASVGLAVAYLLGDSHWQFILALVLAIFTCERLGLEQSLRPACVTVTLVMLAYGEHLLSSSIQRVAGVMVGCAVALLAQSATALLLRRFEKDTGLKPP